MVTSSSLSLLEFSERASSSSTTLESISSSSDCSSTSFGSSVSMPWSFCCLSSANCCNNTSCVAVFSSSFEILLSASLAVM